MTSGDKEVQTGGSDPMTLRMSEASARHFRDLTSELGSVLTGHARSRPPQAGAEIMLGGRHSC